MASKRKVGVVPASASDLVGKRCLVTGGGSGIGVAVGAGVAAGAQAAKAREAITSKTANIEKRFIFFSISKVVICLHMFCTYIVRILHALYSLSIY